MIPLKDQAQNPSVEQQLAEQARPNIGKLLSHTPKLNSRTGAQLLANKEHFKLPSRVLPRPAYPQPIAAPGGWRTQSLFEILPGLNLGGTPSEQ